MQVMTDSFRNVFKSERLVYTALDETDRCKDFWWKCRGDNLVNRSLIEPRRPAPPSRAASDKNLGERVISSKPYLAVLVCLPAAADAEEPEPIGFVVLGKSFPDCAEYSLGFLQEHQNKGYGREAIRWAANYAFTWCNLRRVSIGSLAYNERAIHLYASMGFV